MLVRVSTIKETKILFTQMLLNKTDKISKITDFSVLNAVAFGSSKVSQKVSKDTAIIEASLFPEQASGDVLDEIAMRQGSAPRFQAQGSSTYLRVVADPGTVYQASVVSFINSNGLRFVLIQDYTISDIGYEYMLVRSVDKGLVSNVEALTINRIDSAPTGHIYLINEYGAEGGMDLESDDKFRSRIIHGFNYLAAQTLQKLTQLAMVADGRVLNLVNLGRNSEGSSVLGVVPVNGINFTVSELEAIFLKIKPYLSISDLSYGSIADTYGTILSNIIYREIDVDFRVDLYDVAQADKTRVDIQIKMGKYVDYRFWKPGNKVEWDSLLDIVKNHPNVKYVYDNYFTPSQDIIINDGDFPRIKSFVMRDADGNIIVDKSGYINPIYYPKKVDKAFINTIDPTIVKGIYMEIIVTDVEFGFISTMAFDVVDINDNITRYDAGTYEHIPVLNGEVTRIYTASGTSADTFTFNGLTLSANTNNLVSITLKDLGSLTILDNAFINLYGLTSFNVDCDTSNIESIYSAWRACLNLEYFPAADWSNVWNWRRAWLSCNKLICIAGTLDSSNLTNGGELFNDCHVLVAPDAAAQADIENGIPWTNPNSCP